MYIYIYRLSYAFINTLISYNYGQEKKKIYQFISYKAKEKIKYH